MKGNNDIVNLNSMIDFTLLDARANFSDLEKLCDIAYKNSYYSVCVNPANVKFVYGYIHSCLNGNIKIASVVGFPLGANTTELKVLESKQAICDGADEIDFVVNIGMIKSGDFDYVKNELVKVRKATKKHVLKVIIETCYLTENEIVKLCNLCAKAKVDFVKTSTGFGTAGANEKVIGLMRDSLKGKCQIKVSGGIRTREQAIRFCELGAARIGTSHIL